MLSSSSSSVVAQHAAESVSLFSAGAQPGAFPVVPVADPAAFSDAHFHGYRGDTTGDPRGLQFSKGTTTLAFKFQGGVVVSVDSRSTQGPYIGAWRAPPPPPPHPSRG